MKLSLLVALDRNQVIGREGRLPWHLPADLKHFKAITMGKPIIMGRKTHESVGRPLPGRRNIVLTHQADYTATGCEVFSSLELALDATRHEAEVMIVGGAALYAAALPLCTRLYITEVDVEMDGDVHFPSFARTQWREVSAEHHAADATHACAYSFKVLDRIN